MKRVWGIFLLSTFIVLAAAGMACGQDSVYSQHIKVNCSAGTRTVQAVFVDLKDPQIKIEAAVANNQIGTVNNLANIAGQLASPNREVLAAINGTFFDAYGSFPTPWGTIQKQGEFIHLGNTGTAIGFTEENQVLMDHLYVTIDGYTGGKQRTWLAWGLNHAYDNARATAIFTPAFGNYTGDHNKTSIVVNNGRVVAVKQGGAEIKPYGFTIVSDDPETISACGKVGTPVSYQARTSVSGWDNAATTVSAGPTLIRNGSIAVNPVAEGFTEAKITQNQGQRSFIGVRTDNVLVLGTVGSVSVYQEAEIARSLGLINAMNLDGGASSGLYYRGSYLTSPGRLLSNALVVTRSKSEAAPSVASSQNIKVILDGEQLSFDVPPVMVNGRTLVPLRGIFEAMGAEVDWDGASGKATARKSGTTIELIIGAYTAHINGQACHLDVAPMIINGRTLVPLRFISEALDADVDWDGATKTVTITSH